MQDDYQFEKEEESRKIRNGTRLMELLEHAINEADGWHDDARDGKITGDKMIDEARELVECWRQHGLSVLVNRRV